MKRKTLLLLWLLAMLLAPRWATNAWGQTTKNSWAKSSGIYSKYNPETKFAQDGVYAGRNQSQEVVEKRTHNGKTFDNGDGTYTLIG